jgi:predicted permease
LSSIVTPLDVSIVGSARRGLLFLFGAIGAVLLIACSNLANLSLSRAVARMREGAIRTALGATGRRLILRAVAEQLVLAVAGGSLGIWMAWAAIAVFVRTAPIDLPRVSDVALDARVVLFAALVSIATGLCVAILPAMRAAAADGQSMLRAGGTAIAAERTGMRTRNTLLALQVGLAVTLLVVTTLLGTSLVRVLRIDTGFSPQQVLAIDVAMPATRYATDARRLSAFDRLLERASALPGVERVSTVSLLPFTGGGQVNFIVPEGGVVPRSEQASANFRFIAPDYFRTIGLPLRHGRSFTLAERAGGGLTPAIVSEGTAARLWPGEDALGKRFSRGIEQEPGFEVIGVANEARTTSLEGASPLMVYVPYWWRTRASTSLLLKTTGAPEALTASVRRVIAEIDPEIAVGQTRTVGQLIERAIAPRRYQATLFVVFGVVALFIATIGVYSITAYGVSQRRREMNIRAALGARPSEVRAMIVRQTGLPMVLGITGGILGAVALASVIRSLLFEVGATDPRILAAVVAVVLLVGITTSAIAARRHAQIDPASALREA